MEISRRTDYAIRIISALIDSDGQPLSVRKVAEEYEIPYSFARSIQHELVLSKLIISRRGAKGGMILNHDPETITLLDVVEAMQGPFSVATCSREEKLCPRDSYCSFHPVWMGADSMMRAYLSSVSMKELMDGTAEPEIPSDFFKDGLNFDHHSHHQKACDPEEEAVR